MTRRIHIGRLAQLSGRSVHTIRWYEARGLIPNVGRDAGGRRVYVDGHVEHLAFLEWLRRTGMSVEDMRAFTALGLQGWRTIPQREERLRDHRRKLERDIAMLQGALQLIDAKLDYFAQWRARKKRPPALLAMPALAEPREAGPTPGS
ncbi:MAG TPA: MerR family transcriptional regulator [Caulobacter sp.]|nr:MerR family transcriptional regulator [Caulobacter sp.]